MQTPMMQIHTNIKETVKVFGANIPFVWAKLLLKVRDAIEDEKKIVITSFTEGQKDIISVFNEYFKERGYLVNLTPSENDNEDGERYYNEKYNAKLPPTT